MVKLLDRRATVPTAPTPIASTFTELRPLGHPTPGTTPAPLDPPTRSDHRPSADGGDDLPPDIDNELARHDGRGRRRQALVVVGVALATGMAGMVVGSQVRSPADEAAARQAPLASQITVPVARQQLQSSLVLSGEVRFSDPYSIRLGGLVGLSGEEAQVITRMPELDQSIAEGDAAFEVSGRPVIFVQGDLPMYRRLAVGMEGLDVAGLEAALERMGYETGNVDGIFDEATADAVASLYSDAGYAPEGATDDQRESLRLATESVTQTEQSVRDAQASMTAANEGRAPSELLSLQQAVDAARAAVPIAQRQAANDNVGSQQAIDGARADLATATARRDAAVATSNAATQAGAIDPDTGAEFTAARRQELLDSANQAERERSTADQALTNAINAQPVIKASGDSQIRSASDALQLAELQLAEAKKPLDTAAERANLDAAKAALIQAQAQVVAAQAAAGLRISPGELLFVPSLPTTVTEVYTSLGSGAAEQLGTVSSAETTVVAGVSRADSGIVEVGAKVTIEMRDIDLEVQGTVLSIGAPQQSSGQQPDDGLGQQPNQGGESSRLQVVIAPDDPTALRDQVYGSAKIRIEVGATVGDVLVVPVAALTVGADGVSRVLVETSPATEDSPATNVSVSVEVGLSTQGLAEVRPLDPTALDAGDNVVVGTETNERRGSTDDSTDENPDGEHTGG